MSLKSALKYCQKAYFRTLKCYKAYSGRGVFSIAFPSTKCPSFRMPRRRTLSTISLYDDRRKAEENKIECYIELYCHFRMPYSEKDHKDMVECSNCCQWYDVEYEKVDDVAMKNIKAKWLCKKCKK